MSIAAGIVFATTTLVTFTWATLGRQLAARGALAESYGSVWLATST